MPDTPIQTALPLAWASLIETLPVGVMLTDASGQYIEVNAAAARILGRDRATLLSSRLPEPRSNLLAPNGSVLSPEDTPGGRALRTGKAVPRQVLGVVRDDGDVLWLEVSSEPLPEGGVMVTFDDVTRQHLTETILAARARIAELAATATLEQVLRATLDEAEHLTGSCIGFYHFMAADQKTLTLQAWSTRTESEFCSAEGKGMHYPVDLAGVWVDAVQARKPVIHNDYANLPHKKGLPEGHAKVQREMVVPVLRGERIVALLGVGNKPFPYGNRDRQTVQRLADLAWDIAERKRSEEALRDSEARYRTQFENMTQGAFRQRLDGTFADVNPAALDMLGLSKDAFLARTSLSSDWDMVQEDGAPLPVDQYPSMIAWKTGKKVAGTVVGILNPKTQERVWVEVNAIPEYQDAATGHSQVLVTLHDITARRKAEEKALEQQARINAIFNTSLESLFLTDSDTDQLVDVNPAFLELSGYSRDEVIGRTTHELNLWWDPEERTAYLNEIRHKRRAELVLVRIRTRDGRMLWGQANSVPLGFGSGKLWLHTVRNVTDRNRKEQDLLASEARFRAMFEESPIGIWEEDFSEVEAHLKALRQEGVTDFRAHFAEHPNEVSQLAALVRILNINRASIHDLKAHSEEEIVRNLPSYFTPASFDAFREALLALAEGKTYFRTETPHLDAHGNLLEFDISFTVVSGHGESPSRLLVSFLDITERKANELALRESELRAREAKSFNDRLLATMPIGAVVYRGDTGRCVLANEALAQYIGGTPETLLAQCFRDLPSWKTTGMLEVAERVLATGQDEHLEVQVTSTFGKGAWLSCDFSTFTTVEGPHLLALCVDISERKRAELALMQSERQYRGLFDSMQEGLALHEIITDDQGHPVDYRFLDVNPAFVEMTGIPKSHWIGRTVLDVLPGTEPRWIQAYGQVALTGQPIAFEDESKDLGRWYRIRAYRPAPRQFAVLVTDITEQKCAELERQQLEQQVARTQKMESLGSLAGGVAHDMNNVLGAIMGLASIHQEQEPEGSRLRKSMDTILKACTRGRTLVKGLLGFARQGLEEVRILDLNEVVREDIALLERTIPASVWIDLDLAKGLRSIHGDPASLSHVLMNLCVNALDAMPNGGTLRIRTQNLDPDLVCLEVTDTGCGMTSEVLEKALDPFFTTKGQGKGTGLGLAIVYGTVKAHHGRLELASAVGSGTQVLMQFPATPDLVPAETSIQQQHADGRRLNLLLIDDDELIQVSLSELLHSMGHLPTIVGSGEEALRRLEEGLLADAVLLDLNMPGLGGAGTLPLLRAAYPDLPVFLVTGRADQTAMDLVARHSKTLLLPKPFSAEEIAGHLRQLGLT